jgi:hypothetical protein
VQLMLSYGAQGNIALLPTCPIPPAMIDQIVPLCHGDAVEAHEGSPSLVDE